MGELLLALPPFSLPASVSPFGKGTWPGLGGEESYSRGAAYPYLRGRTDLTEETAWARKGHSRGRTGELDTLLSRLQNKGFYSKGTCAEAVGEEKRETKEIGGRGQGKSLIQTRKWMLSVEA